MVTVAIVQARWGSSRLPGKVLIDLGDQTALSRVTDAAAAVTGVDKIVVATSVLPADDQIATWCAERGLICYRGSEADVLARVHEAAEAEGADTVMRLTADCPLLDPFVCSQVLLLFRQTGADYASNVDPPTWPDGLDCEVFTASTLASVAAQAVQATDREHVTPFIRGNRKRFRVENLECPVPGLAGERWTLDTISDLQFLRAVLAHLPSDRPTNLAEVLAVLADNCEIYDQHEGVQPRSKGGSHDPSQIVSFGISGQALLRAERTIPLGSQTFSKSHIQLPQGKAPYFVTHGDGGRICDVDGNRYVDLSCGLLAVLLGYRDPDVDQAIRRQLHSGISYSLASELEGQLAERLVEIIPCAEQVRFGKNGSDATSASIRVARAATRRDRIAICGYHGWQDWYIGATSRNKGVPKSVQELTTPFPYNDLDALYTLFKVHPGEFAAVIMEPMSVEEPAPDYLATVAELVHKQDAVLIFDEIVTGFRYALGGAQDYFGVTPDLAVFGKGMGNGMPISAIVGRADLMGQMEEIFFSATFGGESLSLAASISVIEKIRREPVIPSLWKNGQKLASSVSELIKRFGLGEVIRLRGKAPWKVMVFEDHATAHKEAIRTLWMCEMIKHGVFTLGSHNICYAHNDDDLAIVSTAWEKALTVIREELDSGDLERNLPCPAIEPVFRVR